MGYRIPVTLLIRDSKRAGNLAGTQIRLSRRVAYEFDADWIIGISLILHLPSYSMQDQNGWSQLVLQVLYWPSNSADAFKLTRGATGKIGIMSEAYRLERRAWRRPNRWQNKYKSMRKTSNLSWLWLRKSKVLERSRGRSTQLDLLLILLCIMIIAA